MSFLRRRLKGNKVEYDFMGNVPMTCSRSLFPQQGHPACWWLERHSDAVGVEGSELEEQFDNVSGKLCGFLEIGGLFSVGNLDGEGVVGGDLEDEVAGFAIDGRIAGDSETLGVVKDDDGIPMGDVRVEPRETAAGQFYFCGADILEESV